MKRNHHLLMLAVAAVGSTLIAQDAAVKPSGEFNPPHNPMSLAAKDGTLAAMTFYIDLCRPGQEKAVLARLHPSLAGVDDAPIVRLIENVRKYALGGVTIVWSSKPAYMLAPVSKGDGSEKKNAATEDRPIVIFTMANFKSSKGKPAIFEREEEGKGLAVYDLSQPRLDIWVKDKGEWYVIPHEMADFGALVTDKSDISGLAKLSTLPEKKPSSQ